MRLPDPREHPLLTVAEVAELMPASCGEKAVRAAIADEQLPSVRVGRYVFVPTSRFLIEVLGLDPTPHMGEDSAPTAESVATATPLEGARNESSVHTNRNRSAVSTTRLTYKPPGSAA